MQILDDESREFFTSQMVRLELLPKPRFERRTAEVAFYENHFKRLLIHRTLKQRIRCRGRKAATRYGLAGPDALQLAAALRHNVAEFYTSERPGKPMFRVKELKVISLFSLLTSQ
jgi:hypothetical protein